jgi:FkbM family methyltransferase
MGTLLNLLGRLPPSWVRAAGALRGRSIWLRRMTDWLPGLLRGKEGQIKNGLGRGLRFNPGPSSVGFLFGTHDLEVQSALGRLLRPGMTAFDLGANVGFTAVLMARCVSPGGRVVCFEPLPANAELIAKNAALNGFDGVVVRPEAVGRADGEAEFFLSHSPTWGRLAQAGAAPEQSGSTRVPVRSLDSLWAAGLLPRPDVIKIDVEGAEADVIAGAREFLAATRPVLLIELHHTNRAVAEAFEGLGYVLRVLDSEAEVATSEEREVQLIAYPSGRDDAEVVWKDLAARKVVFPSEARP